MKEESRKRCRGVPCVAVGCNVWEFTICDKQWWRLYYFGKRLYRMGELVAEGLPTLADAVTYAKGFEQALGHVKLLRNMPKAAFESYVSAAWELWLTWHEKEDGESEQQFIQRLAAYAATS